MATDIGHRIAEEAMPHIKQIERVIHDSQRQQKRKACIRIGGSYETIEHVVGRLIATMMHHGVECITEPMGMDKALNALSHNEIDYVTSIKSNSGPSFGSVKIHSESMRLVSSPNIYEAYRDGVAHDIIIVAHKDVSLNQRLLLEKLQLQRIKGTQVYNVDTFRMARELAVTTKAIALMPESIMRREVQCAELVIWDQPTLNHSIETYLIWHTDKVLNKYHHRVINELSHLYQDDLFIGNRLYA